MIYIQCDLTIKGVNGQLVRNWVEVDARLRLRLLDIYNHALYDAEGRMILYESYRKESTIFGCALDVWMSCGPKL